MADPEAATSDAVLSSVGTTEPPSRAPRRSHPSPTVGHAIGSPELRSWPRHRSRWSSGRGVALAILCAGLMALTYQAHPVAAEGSGGGGGSDGSNNTTGTVVYPYVLPAALFPAPANVSSAGGVALVSAIPFPGSAASYAVVNASASVNGSGSSVGFEVASYNPTDAALIAENGSCGAGCGDLPIAWSNYSPVATFPSSVTALKVASLGSELIVAATSGGETDLFTWSSARQAWVAFGPSIAGQLASIATDPSELAVATIAGQNVTVATVTSSGTLLGAPDLVPTGANATNVVSAAVALAPEGGVFGEFVVFSVNGADQLEGANSTNGATFSTPEPIGSFVPLPAPTGDDTEGQTLLGDLGGVPGQLSLATVGSELTLLYTSYADGQVVPVTEGSGNGGGSWQGPYLSGPINGTTLDPVLTTGPSGLVYAAWLDPDFGPGTVEEATYEADGLPASPPESIDSVAQNGTFPVGAATIAVDAFARPLLLWPSEPPNSTGALAYTGGYLPANTSLNVTEQILAQSLGAWDFSDPVTSASGLASFLHTTSSLAASIDQNLSSGDLCAAQNLTGIDLYQNITHVPLATTGSPSCSSRLDPSSADSPILEVSGIEVPNTYLAIYLDWALEAEGVSVPTSPLSAVTDFSPYAQAVPAASLPQPETASKTVDSETASVTVTPTPYSPTAYELAVTDTLPTWRSSSYIEGECEPDGPVKKFFYSTVTTVTKTWENVSLDNGTVHPFNGTTSWPEVWAYNLSEYQTYYWHATFAAQTSEIETLDDPCTGKDTNETIDPASPTLPTMALSGTFATSLTVVPGNSFVTAAFNSEHTDAQLTMQFNSTLPTTVQGSLSNASGTQSWLTSTDEIDGAYTLPESSAVNQQYTVSVAATSRVGQGTSPGLRNDSFAESENGVAPAQTADAACTFTLSSYVPTVSISNASGAPYTSLNASTVNVTWNATADDLGFLTYYEVGTPINWTITGIHPTRAANGNWVYSLELHGLEPMVAYNATFGVSWQDGCLVEEDQIVGEAFQTAQDPAFDTDPTLPYVWETGLPYDSVTGVGGGADFGWDTPINSTLGAGTHTLVGGYVEVWNPSDRLVVPFAPDQVVENVVNPKNQSGGTNLLNLSSEMATLAPDASYTYKIVANYTYEKKVKGKSVESNESASRQGSFPYLHSTSDDGLTDAEKEAGWTVPLSPNATYKGGVLPLCQEASPSSAAAQACENDPASVVMANPADYATNGLVGDLVEKEYDLNPNTIDTAGSHMLDTWNLTFDLGLASSSTTTKRLNSLATDFRFYYENSTYDFAQSCQSTDPGGGSCSVDPSISGEPTNLTCLGKGVACHNQKWVGDSAPWAATQLWSYSSLVALETLIQREKVGWLRAVTGTYDGERTVTVWGKLSWGANPLVSSTSHDGLVDGDQLDPLGPVIFQLNLSAWEDWAVPSDGGASAAPYISISSPNGTTTYYQGYGPCSAGANCPIGSWQWSNYPDYLLGWTGAYNVSIPIVSSSQYVAWDVQIFDADSPSGAPFLIASVVNSTTYWEISSWEEADLPDFGHDVGVDLDLWNDSDGDNWEGFVALNYTIVTEPPKANTLLVTPANETTLSSAPWGLKRYVGEPDFDVLVLNLTNTSSPLTVSGIGNAEGTGSYSVTLDPGLNNLLVPRGIFLDSPLGQALLNDSDVALPYTAGVNFSGGYWSNRVLEEYTPLSDPDYIQVFAPGNESEGSAAALGGLTGDPGLEVANESWQVQSVVWINVSASTSVYTLGGASELEDLLGGLVLNATGNVTNDVISVTGTLTTLDLPSNVLAVLTNYTVPSDGAYPAPQYDPALAVHEWNFGPFLDEVWNSPTGVAGFVKNGVRHIASVEWSVATAAQAYLAGAVGSAMSTISHGLEELPGQTVSGLEGLEWSMGWSLGQVRNHLVQIGISMGYPVWEQLQEAIEQRAIQSSQDLVSLLWAGVNETGHPSAGNTSDMLSQGQTWVYAESGDSPLVYAVGALNSELGTFLADFVGMFNPDALLADIWGGLYGQNATDVRMASAANGQVTGWGILSSLEWLLNSAGGASTADPSSFPEPANILAASVSAISSLLSGLTPSFSSLSAFFQWFLHSIQPPLSYTDLYLTLLAFAFFVWASAQGLAAVLGPFLTYVGIGFTVTGIGLFLYPAIPWNYFASIITDALSIVLDALELVIAPTEGYVVGSDGFAVIAIADASDMTADWFDIMYCLQLLGIF